MGFPVGYYGLAIPSLLSHLAFTLSYIKTAMCWALHFVGVSESAEPDNSSRQDFPHMNSSSVPSISAHTIREKLPVVTFGIYLQCQVKQKRMFHRSVIGMVAESPSSPQGCPLRDKMTRSPVHNNIAKDGFSCDAKKKQYYWLPEVSARYPLSGFQRLLKIFRKADLLEDPKIVGLSIVIENSRSHSYCKNQSISAPRHPKDNYEEGNCNLWTIIGLRG